MIPKYQKQVEEYAEIFGCPPLKSWGQQAKLKTIARRIIAGQKVEKAAEKLVREYIKAAPGTNAYVDKSVKLDTGPFLRAWEQMMWGLMTMGMHKPKIIAQLTEKAETAMRRSEDVFKKGNINLAGYHASKSFEWATLLKDLDQKSAAKADALIKNTEAMQEKIKKEYAKRVAKNRLPKGEYPGSDAGKLKAKIKQLYRKKWPAEKPLKVVLVSSSWRVEWEARWNDAGTRFRWAKFQILDQIAVSSKHKKKYMVHFVQAYRAWTGKGWGPVRIMIIPGLYPYEILGKHAR